MNPDDQRPQQSPETQNLVIQPATVVAANADEPIRPEVTIPGCTGCMGCLGAPLVIIALIAVVLIFSPAAILSSIIDGIRGIFSMPPTTATVIDMPTIVNSVQPLGQLVSVSAQLAKADIRVVVNSGALNSCGHNANHVAVGTVEAGIDLSRFDEGSVSFDETTTTYNLRLPAPQLTSCRIDFIRQYNRSFSTCPIDWDEARLLANYEALGDFASDALEGGILERAEREARIVLENFIRALTKSNVSITFDDTQVAAIPVSCVPQAPEGWSYSEENQAWLKRN